MVKREFMRGVIKDKMRNFEDKEIFNQILESEKNIKEGKIKEFKYQKKIVII